MHFVIENCSNGENIIKILERKIIFQFLQLKISENIPVPPHLTLDSHGACLENVGISDFFIRMQQYLKILDLSENFRFIAPRPP